MKKIFNISKYFVVLMILPFFLSSCNEDDFLDETPLDFIGSDNSYQTYEQFERALTASYARIRRLFFGLKLSDANSVYTMLLFSGTDVAYAARETSNYFGDYNFWLDPTNSQMEYLWALCYKIIADNNTILSRLNESELSEEEKKLIAAEAKFFRAFTYRHLVYLFGGVPLILEEITAPKTDFVRASKQEVLDQIVADAKEAAEYLKGIDEVTDGRVSNLVAYHLLAETYVALQQYDEAISAASIVIDDPNTSLMTERFGAKANEDPYDEFLELGSGDVYWDLFRPTNQNRSSGNREALWVAQMEIDVSGGYLNSSALRGNRRERWCGQAAYADNVLDPDYKSGTIGAVSAYNGGGKGVAFMRNTDYYLYDVWQSDWDTDIRNAPHNIVRDIYYNNPNSAYYGMSMLEYRSPTFDAAPWWWYPWPSKITTPREHPDQLFVDKDKLQLGGAGSTYRDMYYLRLAETYLLRAEAYFRKGELPNAANDINVVRNRAHASLVSSSDVTLDYILDERARELTYEEPRRITLCRMGMLVERVRKYNPLNKDEIQDFHDLLPIPYSEIEANKDALLEQNPGY